MCAGSKKGGGEQELPGKRLGRFSWEKASARGFVTPGLFCTKFIAISLGKDGKDSDVKNVAGCVEQSDFISSGLCRLRDFWR